MGAGRTVECSSSIRSEKPLMTEGCAENPGAELTIPNTRSHAVTRSGRHALAAQAAQDREDATRAAA